MQPLNALPRQGLSTDAINSCLRTPNIQVAYGGDYLDANFNVLGDLSPWMEEGSTISRSNYATIHGTCTLIIDSDSPFDYSSNFARPWQTLTDQFGNTAKFYLGVYALSTPEIDNSVRPAPLAATGYDLLWYMAQPIGDSISFPVGDNPITDAVMLIQQALGLSVPIQATPTSAVLASELVYPFDQVNQATYLGVVNDLLASAGYAGLWVDWLGTFQLQPYVAPQDRPFEWTFDFTADDAQGTEARNSTQDIFDVPNWWRFVQNGLTVAPVEGVSQFTYTDSNAARPSSYPARGNRFVKKVVFADAVDFPTLQQLGLRTVVADISPSQTFAFDTSPFPLAWHFDQAVIIDPNASDGPIRVQAQSWEMSLDGTSDTSWIWESVQII